MGASSGKPTISADMSKWAAGLNFSDLSQDAF